MCWRVNTYAEPNLEALAYNTATNGLAFSAAFGVNRWMRNFGYSMKKSVNVMKYVKPYSIRHLTFYCNEMISHKINVKQVLVAQIFPFNKFEFLGLVYDKAYDLFG